MCFGFVFGYYPDIGCNPGVIKAVIRKLNNGIQPVIFNDIPADFAGAASCIARKERGTILDNSHSTGVLQFCNAIQQEQHLSIGFLRQTNPKSTSIAKFVFLLHIGGFTLPIDTERRIRDDIVEGIALEFIRIQGVAELHVFRVTTTDQHICLGNAKSKRVDFLTIADDLCLFVKSMDTLFHTGEHLAGAHGHVIDSLCRSIFAGKIRIHGEQVAHQVNNVPTCEVRTGFFIVALRKTLNKIFKHIAHINCRNFFRIHICVIRSEIADNLI